MAASVKNVLAALILAMLLVVFIGIVVDLSKSSCYRPRRFCDCNKDSSSRRGQDSQVRPFSIQSDIHSTTAMNRQIVTSSSKIKYLSYQPPGNGWNNQRIALENALVLAKLLNRTLVVHPMAPHGKGNKLKVGNLQGYEVYNMLTSRDLLPLSEFLDLDLLSKIVPVKEIVTSHPQFVRDYSHLTWRNVCHSPGNGFWVDQLPQTWAQVDLLSKQTFSFAGPTWKERCREEMKRTEVWAKNKNSEFLMHYISDLQGDDNDMIYFENGTLFGSQIRFTTLSRTLQAQSWVVDHVRYKNTIWKTVLKAVPTMGPQFNAIQVRRKYHIDRKLKLTYWIERMLEKKFEKNISIYIATDEVVKKWYRPLEDSGYKLYFAVDLQQYLSFNGIRQKFLKDFMAIYEQCICELAGKFVGAPASTYSGLIYRHRSEVQMRDGLMLETLHTFWIGHQLIASEININ